MKMTKKIQKGLKYYKNYFYEKNVDIYKKLNYLIFFQLYHL